MCEPELRAFAADVRDGRAEVRYTDPPRRVGLFRMRSAYGYDGEARLITTTGFLSQHGLVYRDAPPDPAGRRYRHLYGPWYQFWDWD